jgi:hypothetical protein
LGLNTLIITDIDAVERSTRKKVSPEKGRDLITANNVLKEWHRQEETLDKLLDLEDREKEKTYGDLFAIRVAYQTPLELAMNGADTPSVALPRTFEDALVFENIEFFRNANGLGLVKKFRDAIEKSKSIPELQDDLLDTLKNATKAEFALDMLYFKDPASVQVPEYIHKGLEWLQDILIQRQQEVLVSLSEKTETSEKATQ